MGIDVHFFVLGILVKVEACRVHHISILKFKCHDIVAWLVKVLIWDLNALSFESDCTVFNSIYFYVADHLPLEVNEKGNFCLGVRHLF